MPTTSNTQNLTSFSSLEKRRTREYSQESELSLTEEQDQVPVSLTYRHPAPLLLKEPVGSTGGGRAGRWSLGQNVAARLSWGHLSFIPGSHLLGVQYFFGLGANGEWWGWSERVSGLRAKNFHCSFYSTIPSIHPFTLQMFSFLPSAWHEWSLIPQPGDQTFCHAVGVES